MDETAIESVMPDGASASSRVLSSARRRSCVARTEHFRQIQSLRISSRV